MSHSTEMQLSLPEMLALASDDLINVLRNALGAYTSKKETKIATVEMSIAVLLAFEIGHSCESEKEISIQAEAYKMLIENYAKYTFSNRMKVN